MSERNASIHSIPLPKMYFIKKNNQCSISLMSDHVPESLFCTSFVLINKHFEKKLWMCHKYSSWNEFSDFFSCNFVGYEWIELNMNMNEWILTYECVWMFLFWGIWLCPDFMYNTTIRGTFLFFCEIYWHLLYWKNFVQYIKQQKSKQYDLDSPLTFPLG